VTELPGAVQFIETGKNFFAASVARTQVDTLAAQRPHAARRENFEREIECERAGVKQVERPEIDGAARQISAARRLGDDGEFGVRWREHLADVVSRVG